jgi:hypothetical protein
MLEIESPLLGMYFYKEDLPLLGKAASKQSCVALSNAEAEYVALCAAAQEAVWLQQLMKNQAHYRSL